MKRRETEQLLAMLVRRAEENPGVVERQCIASTKLIVEVVRQTGGRARPMPFKVWVFNPAAVELLREWGALDDWNQTIQLEGEKADQWEAAGARALSIGNGRPPEHILEDNWWDGHVAAIVEDRYLVDLSIGTARSKDPTLQVGPFYHDVGREAGRGEAQMRALATTGCLMIYVPDPDNRDFLTAPAWTDMAFKLVDGNVVGWDRKPAPKGTP